MTEWSDDGTVVVTGGSSGLGRECARMLTRVPGTRVVVTSREAGRAEAAAAEVGAHPMALDLGSLASVRRFVVELTAAGLPPLRGLVCNAGVQFTRRVHTEDGFEATFGINHLGHLALVEGLVDQFHPPARIVFVASATHDPAKPTGMPDPLPDGARALAYPSPNGTGEAPAREGRRRYSTSKLANVRTAYELAARLRDRGITVNAFDPGMMPGTGLARDADPTARLLWRTVARALVVLPGVNTVRASGATLAHLMTAPTLAHVTGAYFVGRKPTGSSVASYDAAAGRELYEQSLRLIEVGAGLTRSGTPDELASWENVTRARSQPDSSLVSSSESLPSGVGWVKRRVDTAVRSSVRAQLGRGNPESGESMRTW